MWHGVPRILQFDYADPDTHGGETLRMQDVQEGLLPGLYPQFAHDECVRMFDELKCSFRTEVRVC